MKKEEKTNTLLHLFPLSCSFSLRFLLFLKLGPLYFSRENVYTAEPSENDVMRLKLISAPARNIDRIFPGGRRNVAASHRVIAARWNSRSGILIIINNVIERGGVSKTSGKERSRKGTRKRGVKENQVAVRRCRGIRSLWDPEQKEDVLPSPGKIQNVDPPPLPQSPGPPGAPRELRTRGSFMFCLADR